MQKIRAFTLMELLIGMIISSILITFCYSSYTIIYKQFLTYKKIKNELTETIQLNSVLNNDFANSKSMYFNKNSLYMNRSISPLEYSFSENYILRIEREVIDTFHITAKDITVNYFKESANSPLFFVNELSFSAMILNEKERFNFSKNYSAETIMNQPTN